MGNFENLDRALQQNPNFPPGCRVPAEPRSNCATLESQVWGVLTDRQRSRIEIGFIDKYFDQDFLGDCLDATTDMKRIALVKKVQGLWLTHRAVELNLP